MGTGDDSTRALVSSRSKRATNGVQNTDGIDVTHSPTTVVAVNQYRQPLIVRAIWFFVVGWWASGIAILVAYVLMSSILLLPAGVWLLHRVPQIQTLRDRTREFVVSQGADGTTVLREASIAQRPFLVRALWFLLIGWWLTAFWLTLAWIISLPIVTLPISIMMIDRAPGILTLQRF